MFPSSVFLFPILFRHNSPYQIYEDVTTACHHLLEAGWIHCDLKENNIIVTRNKDHTYSGKVIDFGLALETKKMPYDPYWEFTPATFADDHVKYPHIAPEILRGETGWSVEGEVYSLGYLFRCTASSFDIVKLKAISNLCMRDDPDMRLWFQDIAVILHQEMELALEVKISKN